MLFVDGWLLVYLLVLFLVLVAVYCVDSFFWVLCITRLLGWFVGLGGGFCLGFVCCGLVDFSLLKCFLITRFVRLCCLVGYCY